MTQSARPVSPVAPARLLRRLVVALFCADAIYFLADFLLPHGFLYFLGLRQAAITTTLILLLGVVGILWFAVLGTALVIAASRREIGWIGVFAGLGTLGLAAAIFLYSARDLQFFLATRLNILARGDAYLAVALVVLIVVIVCPLPVPLAALRYAGVLRREVPAGREPA